PVASRQSFGGRSNLLARTRVLGPIIGIGFALGEFRRRLEARRERCRSAGKYLVMLDIEGAEPALLTHGNGDEIAELDDLRGAEMPVEPIPQRVVRLEVPGDRFGVGQRRFLPFVVARRFL